jgi:hypothetical protein
MSTKAIRIFVSYSHVDEVYKDKLKVNLAQMERKGLISLWTDREILPSEEWDSEIKAALEGSDIVIFLISPDFMASNYINDIEIKKALRRHQNGETLIIPIIIRYTDFQDTPISKFQALPKNAKPIASWDDKDEAWLDVTTQLRKLVTRMYENQGPRSQTGEQPTNDFPSENGNEFASGSRDLDLDATKGLVINGKLKQALEDLMAFTKSRDKDLHNSFLLQLARYNSLKRDSQIGIITPADKEIRTNQLKAAVLSMIDDLE